MIYVLLFGGWFAWTLVEYLVHRFVLHSQIRAFRKYHMIHHHHPHDHTGVPYVYSTIITVLSLTILFLTTLYGFFFGLGLALGYYKYVTAHEDMHNHPHRVHAQRVDLHNIHHSEWHYNYGVSTHIWDRLFGTYKAYGRNSMRRPRP